MCATKNLFHIPLWFAIKRIIYYVMGRKKRCFRKGSLIENNKYIFENPSKLFFHLKKTVEHSTEESKYVRST